MWALLLLGLVAAAAAKDQLTGSPSHHGHNVDVRLWREQAVEKMWNERASMKPTPLKPFNIPGMSHVEIFFKDETNAHTANAMHRFSWALFMWGLVEGRILKNTTVYEASFGNTAVSMAYLAKLIGVRFVAVVPDRTESTKVDRIRKYGAEVIKVPTWQISEKAKQLADKNRGFFINQFANADKAEEYHETTGRNYESMNVMHEIVQQLKAMKKREPMFFVHTAGTGGTISSVGRYVRKAELRTKVVLADTEFSVYYDYIVNNKFKTQGTHYQGPGMAGAGFLGPAVEGVTTSLRPNLIDIVYKIPDLASVAAMYFLRDNGIDAGPTTGINFLAALSLGGTHRSNGDKILIVPIMADKAELYDLTFGSYKWVYSNFHLHGGQKVFKCWQNVIMESVKGGKDPLQLGRGKCNPNAVTKKPKLKSLAIRL